jgi:diguanylate cyclase (GGDEF)-like protein/PAS domain S-box-containing protein
LHFSGKGLGMIKRGVLSNSANEVEANGKKAPLLVRLGLTNSDDPRDNDALRDRVTGFLRAWPYVALAVIVGHGPLALTPQSPWMLAMLVGLALLSVLPLALLFSRSRMVWPPHMLVGTLCVVAAGMGAATASIMHAVGGVEQDWEQLIFIGGAVIIVVTALTRLPVALIAYVIAITVAIFINDTSAVTIGIALPLLLCLLVIAFELARNDFAAGRKLMIAHDGAIRPLRLLEEVEERGAVWFWETDRHARITYLSPKIAASLGWKDDDLSGRPLASIASELREGDEFTSMGERTLGFFLSTKTAFADLSVRANCADDRWWSMSGRPVFDDFNQLRGFIGTGTDLTESRKSEAEKTRLARFDALTGLANRAEIGNLLRQAVSNQGSRSAALFLIDLDRFKNVNDTLGHPAGDALLKQVAQRLANAIGTNGQVGRLGGDEFKVVLPGKTATSHLEALAKAIIESVSRPYIIDGSQVSIGASVGIAIAPEHGRDADDLTRNADLALYAAKAAGRGVHRFYSADMHSSANRRRELESDLERALEMNGLRVVYQPVVACVDEKISGFEALVRWTHPEHGPISPAEFIPIAEESNLIERIGAWVLRRACEEAVRWPVPARVAVNVSAIQFANPAFPTVVTQVLAQTGLSPDRLELEITESVFMGDDANASRQFDTLKRIGVRLALDDFGTGYSSLGYLQRAPLNKIKIDQSFVRGATLGNNQNSAIIRSIVTLAEALGMETTAEGAETEDEIELIKQLGCSHIQGYYYGPPLEVGALKEKLGALDEEAEKVGPKTSRSPRLSLLRRGRLSIGGQTIPVRLRNISETGVLIETAHVVAAGQAAVLDIQDGPAADVTTIWWSDNRCGCAFQEPMSLEWMSTERYQMRIAS